MREAGIDTIHTCAKLKSEIVYKFIDASNGYYTNPIEKKYRSNTNIPFRVKSDEALEKKFIKAKTKTQYWNRRWGLR